jgi:exopolysaccharide production protein ExoZ
VVSERVYSIQALRFAAAAMVALLHITQSALYPSPFIGGFANIGSFGVDVFFVISGFIITRTAPGYTPRQFFARRFARVVPFYWIMTALFVPLVILRGLFTWLPGLATLTFYPELARPWLGVGWTLCFEMLFYSVTALVLFNPRRLIPVALGVFALCWVARLYLGGPFQFFGNPLILEFLAGAALAQIGPQSKRIGACFILLALLLLASVAITGIGGANYVSRLVDGCSAFERVLTMGIPATMLVFGVMQFEIKKGLLTYLGDASYSIYLTHRHAVALVIMTGAALSPLAFVAVAGGLALALSLLAYERIERPVVAWSRSAAKKVKRPARDVPRRRVGVADRVHGA